MAGEFYVNQHITTANTTSIKAEYIRSRVTLIAGKTVGQALQMHFPDGKGKMKRYRLADLRYDARKGYIQVDADADAAIARLASTPPVDHDYDYGWEGDTTLRFFSEQDAHKIRFNAREDEIGLHGDWGLTVDIDGANKHYRMTRNARPHAFKANRRSRHTDKTRKSRRTV